ncbi:T9SS type A sorting domain-containing protein [Brumimicrobium glaciale]|uniref:T9SS type A sorting domain-containing protein n=1 Tax=Brumimicrobium glaciale TaxID=200475 RepID=A0A4Q4KQR4_9FLAO|nr:T9SS type A sorting domain-containing protein [Brumimicrobium glaciale]RYM35860.1 T9SS type A sorting domain-containing protein [Brumimicrobium glaciale]
MRFYKLLLAATFIFVSLFSSAQTYIKPRFVGTPQPGTCNNTVVCEVYNFVNHNQARLVNEHDNNLQVIQHLDTIHNFCYDIGLMQDHNFALVSSNGFYPTFYVYIPPALPKYEFNIINYQPPTADTVRDGSITIQFDSVMTSSSFTSTFIDANNSLLNIVTSYPDNYTVSFDSLSEGMLYYAFQETVNNQVVNENYIYLGDFDKEIVDTGLQVSVNYQHSNGNCEGFIDVFPTQIYPNSNMMIVWNDDQVSNSFSRTALCPGMYAFHVIEASPAMWYSGYIDTIIITNSNDSFIDSSLYNVILDDTITYQIDNCSFDYNLPIDSVDYHLDTISLSQGYLTGLFQLTIYQQQQITYVEDTVYALINSNTLLDIVLYCNNTSSFLETKTPTPDFQSKQFLIMLNSNGVMHGNELSLTSQSYPTISIFPNPMVNELNINSGSESTIDLIYLIDLQGKRQIFNTPKTSNVSLNVSELSNGTYILWYNINDTWYQYKIVK